MYDYKLLMANTQRDLEVAINTAMLKDGYRLVAPVIGPVGTRWYATLERPLLHLTWKLSEAADLAGYKISWSKLPIFDVERVWIPLATIPKEQTSFNVPLELFTEQNQAYWFSVLSFDVAGNESERSIVATLIR